MAAEHVARVGARIAARRKECGLSQRELADRLPGKSDGNQVSKWERGLHRVSDDTLEHIAEVLEVEPTYFLVPEPTVKTTPDLMGALGRQDGKQLDRIEAKLDQLLTALGGGSNQSDEDLLDVARSAADRLAGATPPAQSESTRASGRSQRKRRA